MKNTNRDRRSGRYSHAHQCDGCGGPVDLDRFATDDEVCGVSDGPGFFLCNKSACNAKVPEDLEARRAHYTAQRAKNDERAARRGAPTRKLPDTISRRTTCPTP